MSVLPNHLICKMIEDGIIRNADRDCVSTNAYDLRVNSFSTPSMKRPIYLKEHEVVPFPPFTLMCFGTIETMNFPSHLLATVSARSSYYRDGLFLASPPVDAGYQGGLTLTMFHLFNEVIYVGCGDRLAQLTFHTLVEPVADGFEYGGKQLPHRSSYLNSSGPTPGKLAEATVSAGKTIVKIENIAYGLSTLFRIIDRFLK